MLTAGRQVDVASILVVDDHCDTAESTARWLKLLGHDVSIARDGIEAIDIARRLKPHYVLLDLGLPRMDGYEVALRLRQELAGPLVIIAITGFCQEQDRRRASEAGCDHYFLKPVDPDALISLLSPSNQRDGSFIHDGSRLPAMAPSVLVGSREVEIMNTLGLHLRAADKFVRPAQKFKSEITVIYEDHHASGQSILDLASLAAECGCRLELKAKGPDAETVLDALADLVARRFDEEP